MSQIDRALGLEGIAPAAVRAGEDLPSLHDVSGLLADAVGAVGRSLAVLLRKAGLTRVVPPVTVDRRRASLWCRQSLVPVGWELPPLWDTLAGDYPTRDGWVRLHTNAAHHRAAALRALGCADARDAVAATVARERADAVEAAVVSAGGAAAAMRTVADWAGHPQGAAVAREPLIAWTEADRAPAWAPPDPARPLAGLKVLDVTRILAGPVATRTLAGFGAWVLRIDPPGWEEGLTIPEVALGKACARLDLGSEAGRDRFAQLLGGADVFVHGLRPGALDRLGLGAAARRAINPACIEVTLDAYGWTGPWADRRGFDSLVQMSSGIAAAGMAACGAARPVPLPVQALDHATGYLMAAAVIRALARGGGHARLSLARTAVELVRDRPAPDRPFTDTIGPARDDDWQEAEEATGWGPARRLKPALEVGDIAMRWDRPARPLGWAEPDWGAFD